MAKEAKIELRIDDTTKARIKRYATQAGYKDREFSIWARRVLSGEELHPSYTEVPARADKRG